MDINSKINLNENYKRTKIIATIGPSTNSYELIYQMIKAGVNGIRLNFSHGTHQEKEQQITWIRQASKELKKPVSIIQDLQGPKIRLGDVNGVIELTKNQVVALGLNKNYEKDHIIPIQFDLSKKLKRGDRLYIFDGRIKAVVQSIKDKLIYLKIEHGGQILSKKGINLPDTDLGDEVITAKDRADLVFGSVHDIDYVAQSFVQNGDNVRSLRKILTSLNSRAKIIVKFETKMASLNISEIIDQADGAMVARGDLAYEVLPEAVPIIQRDIVREAISQSKPVIIATQMLFSMTTSESPTRAEVSDIANAVMDRVDCLMLSDETANGNHPVASVKLMKRVILYTEKSIKNESFKIEQKKDIARAISYSVVELATQIRAKAIVAETKSGATARHISSKRTTIPILAVTNDIHSANSLAIVYGVKSYLRPAQKYAATKLTNWLRANHILDKGDLVVSASGKYPGVVGTTDTIKLRLIED